MSSGASLNYCEEKVEILNIKQERDEVPLESLEPECEIHQELVNVKSEIDIHEYFIQNDDNGSNLINQSSDEDSLVKPCVTKELIKSMAGISKELFVVLLEYIQHHTNIVLNLSKPKQLLCVLGKLHCNEVHFIDEFQFPIVFTINIEILFELLQVINYNFSSQLINIPTLLKQVIFSPQSWVIIDMLPIQIKERSSDGSCTFFTVKYLIVYTLDGNICYNSTVFPDISIKEIVNKCNIFDEFAKITTKAFLHIQTEDVTHSLENGVYSVNLESFYNDVLLNVHKCGKFIENYIASITTNFKTSFGIFNESFPNFMLNSEKNFCFLDKIVTVCCKLHNLKLKDRINVH